MLHICGMFTRDNGHFFNCEKIGDFTAELRVQAQYDELYDQAGIMVRLDRLCQSRNRDVRREGSPE
jgi:regulation of enolase protein 1 (concanavalin A-like superfamily)